MQSYLYSKGRELTERVRAMPGTTDIRNSWENTLVKAEVVVDQTQARRVGISSEEIANSLQAHIDGIRATDYREGDQAIPIVLQSLERERSAGSDFYDIRVNSRTMNRDVPLSQIATISPTWEYSRIARRNQSRVLTVELKHDDTEGGGTAGMRLARRLRRWIWMTTIAGRSAARSRSRLRQCRSSSNGCRTADC